MTDEPITSEDAVDNNKLFSRKGYLKQFEPPKVEKKLNGGQSLAKHVKEAVSYTHLTLPTNREV